MRKRQKLVTVAVLSTLGLGVVLLSPLETKYLYVAVLGVFVWILSVWALKEGLSGIEWITVTLPPVAFTISVALFYFLLQESWIARSVVFLTYGVGQYALLLSANIFSVAAIRTIQLFRAASAVGFVMSLLTAFFFYDSILSFRPSFWLTGLCVFVISFLLMLPGLWSVKLENKLSSGVLSYTFWLSVMVGFAAMAISFLPISIAVSSLFLCTLMYIFLGVSQHHFAQRLFPKTAREYVVVGLVVLITMLLTSGWGV